MNGIARTVIPDPTYTAGPPERQYLLILPVGGTLNFSADVKIHETFVDRKSVALMKNGNYKLLEELLQSISNPAEYSPNKTIHSTESFPLYQHSPVFFLRFSTKFALFIYCLYFELLKSRFEILRIILHNFHYRKLILKKLYQKKQ